jgi:DNA-binding transcriptional regulator of glucitol operon
MHITMAKEGYILQWPKKDTYYNGQRRMHITMAKEGYILQWPKKDTYYNGQRRIHITMAKEGYIAIVICILLWPL